MFININSPLYLSTIIITLYIGKHNINPDYIVPMADNVDNYGDILLIKCG